MVIAQFEITDDHMALLREMNWRWEDEMEFGGPAVDAKRPFGNSSRIYSDMADALGWEYDADDRELEATLDALYRETLQVLVVGISAGTFAPGVYERTEDGWQPAGGAA
jgi:hypothetical protein